MQRPPTAGADCEEIYRHLVMNEFPWDHQRALELALFRTFAVPTIGGLLDRSGEFAHNAQRRYDDTALLLAEVLEHGTASARGREALRRINRIHARFEISAEDMRYVLSTFVAVPLRWLDRYGHRPLAEHERAAVNAYYVRVGRLMGIRDVPGTWQDMLAFTDAVERSRFALDAGGTRVAVATRELVVRWLWFVPAPVVRSAVHAMLDDPVREAFGFTPAPRLRVVLDAALRLRAVVIRRARPVLGGRRRPSEVADAWTIRSYPDGYEISRLGPPP